MGDSKKQKPDLDSGRIDLGHDVGPDMFNYFIAGTGYQLKNKRTKIKVVVRKKEEGQIRIPGGSFNPKHLMTVLEENSYFGLKHTKIEDIKTELGKEIGFSEMDEKWKTEDHETRAKTYRSLHAICRSVFEDDVLKELLRLCIVETLRDEMDDEIEGSFKTAVLVTSNNSGPHTKYSAMIVDLEAPETTEGSADGDISRSYYADAGELLTESSNHSIWPKHRHMLRAGLIEIVQSLKLAKKLEESNNLQAILNN